MNYNFISLSLAIMLKNLGIRNHCSIYYYPASYLERPIADNSDNINQTVFSNFGNYNLVSFDVNSCSAFYAAYSYEDALTIVLDHLKFSESFIAYLSSVDSIEQRLYLCFDKLQEKGQ